jgi:hypothetical protein
LYENEVDEVNYGLFGGLFDGYNDHPIAGYSGDADPPCPVMLTPHKDYGSENLND